MGNDEKRAETFGPSRGCKNFMQSSTVKIKIVRKTQLQSYFQDYKKTCELGLYGRSK